MQLNERAILYIPDGEKESAAVERITHLAVAAHQDDIEFMAYAPIADCFGRTDLWFGGVVVSDGAGSPRKGLYADYTDEDMKKIRVTEQKKAAFVGEYGAQFMLGYPSAQVKDPDDTKIAVELTRIFRAAKPRFVYTHNIADKHDTHLGTAMKVIAALRELNKDEMPERVFGCEVWRDLDWLCDEDKIYLDTGAHPNIARALSAVFDSQILGGKRYDIAAEGRRCANATYSESHACDTHEGLNYAMDLTPLILDKKLKVSDFISAHIKKFERTVREKAAYYAKED